VCRVCLKPDDEQLLSPIFAENSKVALQIFILSGVQVCFDKISLKVHFKFSFSQTFRSLNAPKVQH
jgi:hypothetical protein